MKVKCLHFWLFATLSVLFACSLLPAAATPAPPTEAQTVPATPAEDSAVPLFGEGTFTLALPEGWDVAGPTVVTNDPERPYEDWALGPDPTSSGGPGISHVAILDPAQWSPEDFALAQCSTCPQNPFEDVAVGGKPGRRTQVGGGGVPFMVAWYFVQHNGKLIAFAIHDPETLEPLEDVIASIQFE